MAGYCVVYTLMAMDGRVDAVLEGAWVRPFHVVQDALRTGTDGWRLPTCKRTNMLASRARLWSWTKTLTFVISHPNPDSSLPSTFRQPAEAACLDN